MLVVEADVAAEDVVMETASTPMDVVVLLRPEDEVEVSLVEIDMVLVSVAEEVGEPIVVCLLGDLLPPQSSHTVAPESSAACAETVEITAARPSQRAGQIMTERMANDKTLV